MTGNKILFSLQASHNRSSIKSGTITHRPYTKPFIQKVTFEIKAIYRFAIRLVELIVFEEFFTITIFNSSVPWCSVSRNIAAPFLNIIERSTLTYSLVMSNKGYFFSFRFFIR